WVGRLAFMSIGLLAGPIAKTQQAATAIANLVILPMAFLGGAFIPLDFAPNWIKEVSYVMPLRYLVTGMQNVMARGLGPVSALPAISILLAITVAPTLSSVRVFRWDDLCPGRPAFWSVSAGPRPARSAAGRPARAGCCTGPARCCAASRPRPAGAGGGRAGRWCRAARARSARPWSGRRAGSRAAAAAAPDGRARSAPPRTRPSRRRAECPR